MTKRRSIVAVIGDASIPKGDMRWGLAKRLGEALVSNGYRVMTGGLGGVMEAACVGAKESFRYHDGDTIGLLPGFDADEANKYVDISIATGLEHARNAIIANSDAVVAIGGGAGTLSEIALAWSLKRLVIAYKVDGWSGKLACTSLDEREGGHDVGSPMIHGAEDEEDVIILLKEYLPQYNRHHHGIKRR